MQSIETAVLLIQPQGKRLQGTSSTTPLKQCYFPAKQTQLSQTGYQQLWCVVMRGEKHVTVQNYVAGLA